MSNRIKVLDKAVAARIAAGEVVTGPEAVVKELVENAVDAGAAAITVEIADGGRESIRVTDNGNGIIAEDVPLAVEKHATSKIGGFGDLDAISTLGFRGEALCSMAAVSRFTLSTRTRDSISGAVLKVNGGGEPSLMPAGLPEGTTVKVEKLFYNVPARKKFLYNSRSESSKIAGLITRLILTRPGLSIKYISNGKLLYHSPGNGRLLDAMITVYGSDVAGRVTAVDYCETQIDVSGYISRPSLLQKTAAGITFILNGRYIQSKQLQEALLAGYGERVLRSHFPLAVLNIRMPFEQVDVNVHPNKMQVMFSNETAVISTVTAAVGEALAENLPPALQLQPEQPAIKAAEKRRAAPSGPADEKGGDNGDPAALPVLNAAGSLYQKQLAMHDSAGTAAIPETGGFEKIMDAIIGEAGEKRQEEQAVIEDVRKLVDYSVVGQAFQTYLVIECGDALYVIDQHAAHERVTYEAMKKELENGAAGSQQLLEPFVKKFSQADFHTLEQNKGILEQLGFELEEFGPLTYKFSAFPVQVEGTGMESLTDEVLYEIKTHPGDVVLAREKIIQAACKHSIKSGYRLDDEQIGLLMREITSMNAIPTCPHGRPIAVTLTRQELQKGFLRLV